MKKFIVYWLPVLLWAGVIFYSSSQPYEDQDIKPFLSGKIPLEWVNTFSFVNFDYAGEEVSIEALGEARFLEFFIRKGAHLTVYFILGVLLFRAQYRTKTLNYSLWLAIILGVLYAASDEIHQGFTPNRSPHVEDVLIDTVGIILGTIFIKNIHKKRAE
ncbi:VanZ family protein [Pseudalkalibacillus sp. Hm43]|uniref:VanZ family protein n=1 Tax=Pseudalkalibacillus sp. Hm43 TaxID=3450742 RepID=UPI003F43FFE3